MKINKIISSLLITSMLIVPSSIFAENMGDNNVGNNNNGNNNMGDMNGGNENIGSWNFGYMNIGNNNNGDFNVGDNNVGNCNFGNYNQGSNNIGNDIVGENIDKSIPATNGVKITDDNIYSFEINNSPIMIKYEDMYIIFTNEDKTNDVNLNTDNVMYIYKNMLKENSVINNKYLVRNNKIYAKGNEIDCFIRLVEGN